MPVSVERFVRLAVPRPGHGGSTYADLKEHALDLEALYGPHESLSWLDDGEQVTYADLTEAAVEELRGPPPVDPAGDPAIDPAIDMAVTVTHVPDCQARLLPGPQLAHRLGGQPLVVGVNDQGAAGPFTALRLAATHLAAGTVRRAAILIMEQSTLPPEASYALPPHTGAVVLVLGSGPGRRIDGLAIRRLPAARRRPVLRAGHLQPWYEAAARHAEQPGEDLVVADTDEELGYDCRVTFAARPAPAPARRPVLEARP